MIRTRKTAKNLVLVADGYGPEMHAFLQGSWAGKVAVPLSSISERTGAQGTYYEWPAPGGIVERGDDAELFAVAASGGLNAPRGCRRYGCRRIN